MKAQLHAAIIASLLALPSGPTAHADFDKAGAEVELGSGEITEPPPPAEACGITLEPVPEPENIALLCVTPRLRELAAGYPELSGGQIRNNYCLTDDAECQARDARRGDHQLLDEINAVRQGKLDQKTFHDSVSGSDFDRTRTDLATVSYEGYVRGVDKFFLLYRSRPDGKFHESAEGVDLVSRQAVDEEHKMQGRLLEIFAEIKAKLGKSDEDQLSLKALAHYTDRAVHAQKALALISCELGRMAEKNREIEARMGALSSKSIPLSAVSGEVPPDHLPNAEGSVNVEPEAARAPAFTSAEAEILAPFGFGPNASGASRTPALAPLNGEESLFLRVHRKHREKEAQGIFQRTILD